VRDAQGRLVRRVRREAGGREIVLIENETRPRRGRGLIELAPPRIAIPREKYVVEVERASQEDLYEAFTAPPVERIQRRYSLDDVRYNQNLRERVRRVDIDIVTFESGSWRLDEGQVGALTGVATAIRRAIEANPAEVFLVEGPHRRGRPRHRQPHPLRPPPETVAAILSERFQVPAENLTTQGYGEQCLKVATQADERQNRRVTIRRITPLLRVAEAR
jgi:outer membrane protein OmpA-like peptidoglycan-associated protein